MLDSFSPHLKRFSFLMVFAVLVGCSESENNKSPSQPSADESKLADDAEKARTARAELEASESARIESEKKAKADAKDKELADFRRLEIFSLTCEGRYVFTHKGETNTGQQSFVITIEPQSMRVHYFAFEATGSFDSGQRKMDNEVLAISNVDADWIYVESYKFNRNTLKYDYQSGLASGVCEKSETAGEIPARKI